MTRTAAVLVTFNPDEGRLIAVVESLLPQVAMLFLVDNSSQWKPESFLRRMDVGLMEVHGGKGNTGIAAALNIGITRAIEMGYQFLILCDQDTVFPPEYVEVIESEFTQLDANAVALAPTYINVNSGSRGNVESFRRLSYRSGDKPTFQIASAISSGLVLRLELLGAVGLMNEALFIDWVDNEWCWRARSLGYAVYGTTRVSIQHSLGDNVVTIFGREFITRSAVRDYYIVRNAVFLALRGKHLPWRDRLYLSFKTAYHFVAVTFAFGRHGEHLSSCFIGLVDGIRGRLGEKEV